MKYRIKHLTEYHYEYPVANSYNQAYLTPRTLPYQQVHSSKLECFPTSAISHSYQDFLGNACHFIHLQAAHQQFTVIAQADVTVLPRFTHAHLATGCTLQQIRLWQQQVSADNVLSSYFLQPSKQLPFQPEITQLWQQATRPEGTMLQQVAELTAFIYQHFTYQPGFTTLVTSPLEVLNHRQGVCQDFAQLAISCLRANGIAARYVSGYLETLPPAGQSRLQGADASHAWFAVYDPKLGWVDFDPTNNMLAGERHITLAYGRDYTDVPPLKGIVQGSGAHRLTVAVDVLPLT